MSENIKMTLQNVMKELRNQCKKYADNKFTHIGFKDNISIEYHLIRDELDENNFRHTVIECYNKDEPSERMTIDAKSMNKDGKDIIVYIAYIIDSQFYIIETMSDNVSFTEDLGSMFESSFLHLGYLQDNIIEVMIQHGYTL